MSDPLQIDRLISGIVTADVRRSGGVELTEVLLRLVQKVSALKVQKRSGIREAGYREGYKKGIEEGLRKGQTAEASALPATTTPRLFSSTASQTNDEPKAVVAVAPCPVPPSTPCPHSPSTHTDPNDLMELPFHPRSSSPCPASHDLSSLCTGTSQLFASLQRCRRRSSCTPRSRFSSSWEPGRPQTIVLQIYDSTAKIPHTHYRDGPSSFSTSQFTPMSPPTQKQPSLSLDWDRDPRLCDLGRALTALGWVRPG
ncbi:hypothetical protein B0H12DRAFT_1246166 [Mycena haematopus]|nr:hypothetical protein B0H12DRAFT_1246166 [Mycena haematopus]